MAMSLICALVSLLLALCSQQAQACKDAQAALKLHNEYRKIHNVPALEWSDTVAKKAQEWANKLASMGCPAQHSDRGWRGGMGENLIVGQKRTTSDFCVLATNGWYNERKNFKFGASMWSSNAGRFKSWGHFSQVVWKSTKYLGCASAVGKNPCCAIVCMYAEAGNMATDSAFASNVFKPDPAGLAALEDSEKGGKSRKLIELSAKRPMISPTNSMILLPEDH